MASSVRVVIRHLGGSKVNQLEQFPLDSLIEITLGRDQGMSVVFDQRDDMVSRRHAIIKVQTADPPSFRIADTGSSNGTLLNGVRIAGETELLPGDVIELGSGGPRFSFDLDPRPERVAARTRVLSATGAPTATTRMIEVGGPVPVQTTPPTGEIKSSVGRNTVMNMLSEQRQRQRRTGVYALAGMLVLIGLVGAGVYYKYHRDIEAQNREQQAALAQKASQLEASNKAQNAALKAKMGLSPEDIAARFGNATVFVQVQWRLYDRETGKPLFHKRVNFQGQLLPAYVKLTNGKIVRWLTTEDERHSNFRVGGSGYGTGFIVNDQGLIFTNKHIAAAWKIDYRAFSTYEHGQGVLYQQQPRNWNERVEAQASERESWLRNHRTVAFSLTGGQSSEFQNALRWQPEDGGLIFSNSAPIVAGGGAHEFEGRNEELAVRFPGTRVDIAGRLVRASTDADAALVKIDSTEKLKFVQIAQDDAVSVGQRVVCLGYPVFGQQNVAVVHTVENAEARNQVEVIPEPTVTPGFITNISPATSEQGNVTIIGTMGHVYQMSLPSGAGNSGGPIFDDKGWVIGLFTYGSNLNQTVTYAVPIKYARDLLAMQHK